MCVRKRRNTGSTAMCRHRRKDAKARAGDDVLVKLAIDAPENIVRKVVKYV